MLNFRYADFFIAVFVLAAASLLILPVPYELLDLLLVSNIALSLILLFVALYMTTSLSLLSFPTILLLTTLFRLSLNVASSRLILTEGQAGRVIESFGRFLIHGDVVIGVIIFSIITLVNFIVIARGSTRVSEVSARFVLDALPGKQSAIDSDLRSGLITPEHARRKRDEIRKESQLFGSMDGAMKFVQGDAIAGLCIIVTNIVGGMYRGLSQGMPLSEALHTYTVLTVGDGLVTQIPALLISLCAGLVVTRVTAEEGSTLGRDIIFQIFTQPKSIAVTASFLMILGAFSAIPTIPFWIVGVLLLGISFSVHRRQKSALEKNQSAKSSSALVAWTPPYEQSGESVVELSLAMPSLYSEYRQQAPLYLNRWRELQRALYERTGIILPQLSVKGDTRLSRDSFKAVIQNTVIVAGKSFPRSTVAIMARNYFTHETATVKTQCPITQRSYPVFQNEDTALIKLRSQGVELYDSIEWAFTQISIHLIKAPHLVLSSTEIFNRLKETEKRFPGLVSEAFQRYVLPLPLMTEVCYELIKLGGTIADFPRVLEVITRFCAKNQISPSDAHLLHGFDVARAIFPDLSSRETTVEYRPFIQVSPDALSIFEHAELNDRVSGVRFRTQEEFSSIKDSLVSLASTWAQHGFGVPTVVSPSSIAEKVEVFARQLGASIELVGEEEIQQDSRFIPVGVWDVGVRNVIS